jgi:Ca-activated chloride channel family protein
VDAALAKLRAAAGVEGASRQKHEALVRKLLVAGRLDEALAAATRFAELDPDLDAARELLAFAAAATGQADAALAALDALSETSARSAPRHARAARAFEAAGDERRACAHWRALADLSPRDEPALYQALRCRARVMGERDAALEEARAVSPRALEIAKLAAALAGGAPPAFDPAAASAGQFEAKVTCAAEGAACPSVAIIGPTGAVVSPWTPGAARAEVRAVAFSGLSNGTYRVVVAGGAPGVRAEVELRALGAKKTFPVDRPGAHTIAMTSVSGME